MPFEATGKLARGEAQVARQVATGRKTSDVADKGHEGGGNEQADAGDSHEVSHGRQLAGQRLQLTLDHLDPRFDIADLLARFGEDRSKHRWD
jgi:hypothetical protein